MGVIFKNVSVEGFGSIVGRVSFPLDAKGVNLIKGKNGAGKTTLFSAFYWALYKGNLKGTVNAKVQSWERLRPVDFKGTRVAVKLHKDDTQYMIVRHVKYKGTTKGIKGLDSLMIFKKTDRARDFEPSDLLGEEQHKGDQQGYIERVIGMDDKAFLNSVLFGQRMKRLVESDAKEKRELFDKLFEAEFVKTANEKGKAELTRLETEEAVRNTKVQSLQKEVVGIQESLAEKEELLKQFNEGREERLITLRTELETAEENLFQSDEKYLLLEKAYKELEKQIDNSDEAVQVKERKEELADLENVIKMHGEEKSETQRELRTAENNLRKFTEELAEVADKCATCNQALDAKAVAATKKTLKDKIKKEESVITEFEKTLGEVDKKIEAAEKKKKAKSEEITKLEKVIAELDAKLEPLDRELTMLEGAIKPLQEARNSAQERLTKEELVKPPEIDLQALQSRILAGEEELATMRIASAQNSEDRELIDWWVKKGFGANGLKSYIFSAMLAKLNTYVKKYAARLGMAVKFSIDLSMASKPFTTTCYKNNFEVDYEELSGGEKQRVDVALAFAMHDLISETANLSILIMDEVFEGLDDEGIESVFDLIRVKAGDDKSVFIITHSMIIDSLNSKSIIVDTQGEVTVLE